MGKTNGTLSIVKIAWILFGIAAIFVSIGVTYGSLNTKIKFIDTKSKNTESRSYRNEKAIASIQSDIKYIVKGIDELRGK